MARVPPCRPRVASSDVAGSARDRARTEFGFSGGFLPSAAPRPIDASTAMATFLGAWVVAQIVSSLILLALGDGDAPADASFLSLIHISEPTRLQV